MGAFPSRPVADLCAHLHLQLFSLAHTELCNHESQLFDISYKMQATAVRVSSLWKPLNPCLLQQVSFVPEVLFFNPNLLTRNDTTFKIRCQQVISFMLSLKCLQDIRFKMSIRQLVIWDGATGREECWKYRSGSHRCRDHEEPCGPSHRSFCLNGGICYVIPTVPSPFCRKGQLQRASSAQYDVGLVETSSIDIYNKHGEN
ncbi:pro-neuregulin-4, membrane-bound isoform isoform X3 [Dromiciops gliroides]|uniref:pro-neuregulin-4, membrane-bound isoform isoform X3 n=1 Tax=Dromiciops gliroides TaxID=33562 RepID=UPI001CC3A254|nr:pro-neuregulin-4, membrane-bound isoform isoform X3 [Dromiciops gliroides]